MNYIVKWVEMDDIFNYYPCLKIFSIYNDARNFQLEKEEEIEQQQDKLEELYDGKIISEIYLEEIAIPENVKTDSNLNNSDFQKVIE